MATSMGLVQKLQEMDREIMVNPQYVQKVCCLLNIHFQLFFDSTSVSDIIMAY